VLVLEVDQAIPCRSVENSDFESVLDRHTNVELDPASEVEMRELVDEQKLRVVGWYHSHPTFVPNPSLIDLLNQKNYQAFFRSADEPEDMPIEESAMTSGEQDGLPKMSFVAEPFVGVIVGNILLSH
jgi:proteasome lid subunit RPN8/RPN11